MSGKARSRTGTVCSQRRDLGCLSADRRDSGQDRTVGDEIDSIRSFDVESQRSVENMEQVVIYPATENVEKEEQAVSVCRVFSKRKKSVLL